MQGLPLWVLKDKRNERRFDVYSGFVVAAGSESSARRLASKLAADEGASTWLDDTHSSCEKIADDSMFIEKAVILEDFNAG